MWHPQAVSTQPFCFSEDPPTLHTLAENITASSCFLPNTLSSLQVSRCVHSLLFWPRVDVMLITVLRLDVHPIWPLPSRQKDLFLYVGFPPRISKRYSPPNFRWMADNFSSSGTLHGVSRRCEFTSWTSRWWLADG